MGWESDGDIDHEKYTWTCHRCGRKYDLDHYNDIDMHVNEHKTNEAKLKGLGRISREQMLMEVAAVVARRGTCSRAQVGVVFAKEGRILATGYNGAPAGMDHCVHESHTFPTWKWNENLAATTDPRFKAPRWMADVLIHEVEPGSTWYWDGQTASNSPGCTVVEHAERNAIAFAARYGIALGGSDAFCTHAPCLDCARALLGTGIRSLVYKTPYRLTAGVELLRAQGIKVLDTGSID